MKYNGEGFVGFFRQRARRDNFLISLSFLHISYIGISGLSPTSSIASTHLTVRIPHSFSCSIRGSSGRSSGSKNGIIESPDLFEGSVASTTLATSLILLRLPVLFRSFNPFLTSLTFFGCSVFIPTDRELKRETPKGRKLTAARKCRHGYNQGTSGQARAVCKEETVCCS